MKIKNQFCQNIRTFVIKKTSNAYYDKEELFMSAKFFILLCVLVCLSACTHNISDEDTEISTESQSVTELQSDSGSVTSDIPEVIADIDEEIVWENVDVIFSLRESDLACFSEETLNDPDFADAIARTALDDIGNYSMTLRVTYMYSQESKFSGSYEVYRAEDEINQTNLLGKLYFDLTSTADGYVRGEQTVIDGEACSRIRTKLENGTYSVIETGTYLSLDHDNRIILHTVDGVTIPTELFFTDSIDDIEVCNLVYADGDSILICGRENRYYSIPLTVSISRDGGQSWHTDTPALKPLGTNGLNTEAGFSKGIIQRMDDGRFYIFLNTNLSSMTVLSIPADSDEVQVLFREQIGGYETTSLVDAAMVTETRGFYTLAHPKYAASNAIYRTTDGGVTWIRCSVPMPDEVSDPWTMELHLPWQEEDGPTWYMKGVWDGGDCEYISYDGGWTWSFTNE